jgi:hypothetical protein
MSGFEEGDLVAPEFDGVALYERPTDLFSKIRSSSWRTDQPGIVIGKCRASGTVMLEVIIGDEIWWVNEVWTTYISGRS